MGLRRFYARRFALLIQRGVYGHRNYHAATAECLKIYNCCSKSKIKTSCLCKHFSESKFHFPWRQNAVDNSKEDPIHHKLIGMILMRRVLKNYSKEEFNLMDFIEGVKIAIQALSQSIMSQDKEGHMIKMLGNDLHDQFRRAFDEMKKAKQKVALEVENSKDFRVSGVRAVCGSADPGDEYCINFLGQKIITSKHDMFELEKRADAAGFSSLFDYGRKLGFSAAEKQLKFQLDIKFSTNERFYVEEMRNGNWQIVVGSVDVVSTTHNMRFETLLEDDVNSDEYYPFSWKIIDIDFEDKKSNVDS